MNTQLTAHAMAAHTDQDILQIEDLSVNFGTDKSTPFCALNGVSLSIKEGEVLGLVGESGSGKTVLSHSILGLLPKNGKMTKGRIYWKGQELQTLSEKRLRPIRGKEIAMIFQDPQASLNPVYTVGRQIEWVLKLHRNLVGASAKAEVFRLFKSVKLRDPERCYAAYAKELSGGMAQRVMIAMALAGDPKLLIADEPTSALDVTVQAEIAELLIRVRDDFGLSILFITHDLGLAAHICSRVAVMHEGCIVESGSTENVFQNPVESYTKRLVGSLMLPKTNSQQTTRPTLSGI